MKYIMFSKPIGGIKLFLPIIFPNNLVHADVAKMFLSLKENKGFVVDSAGEYIPMSGQCCGGSETLGVSSDHKRDTKIIQFNDYGGGFL